MGYACLICICLYHNLNSVEIFRFCFFDGRGFLISRGVQSSEILAVLHVTLFSVAVDDVSAIYVPVCVAIQQVSVGVITVAIHHRLSV